MIIVAIDIGLTGAVAAMDSHGTYSVADIPTEEIPNAGLRMVKRRVSAVGLRDMLRTLVPPGEVALALIEDVHAGMGPGAAARSSLDLNRGRIEAVLELQRFEVKAIQPGTWKRFYGLTGKDKRDNLDKARVLFGQALHMLKRQKDHNRADALLMAHYGRQVLA
jgi:hypothetical protein